MASFDELGDGIFMSEGHDHAEDDLFVALVDTLSTERRASAAEAQADQARLCEVWYSDEHGFGHDCSGHADVPKELWAPGCGGFRPVTIAADIPPAGRIDRAVKVAEALPADPRGVVSI